MKYVKYYTHQTSVVPYITVPETAHNKEFWTDELPLVIKSNYDALTAEQLAKLQAEVDEYNDDAVFDTYTPYEWFEQLVIDACETGDLVN